MTSSPSRRGSQIVNDDDELSDFISGPKTARGVHGSQIPQTQAFFQAKILITDQDLPRAFCLVKVNKMLFFSAESQDGSQAVGLHFVMCERKTFGRISFAVLEGEECIFEVYVCDSESERRWALVRCIPRYVMMMILG